MRNFHYTFETRKQSFISDSADLHSCIFNVRLEKSVPNIKRRKRENIIISFFWLQKLYKSILENFPKLTGKHL